ncbi:hypothetical protein [Xylanivirga thermophila]|uniref:hypothetical protein n=1 Tax=Xylanivirga thermophila TaxID=2496273 RepID=UPI00101CC304|nr:hypothetical protein [Xylanivirga thermophila]
MDISHNKDKFIEILTDFKRDILKSISGAITSSAEDALFSSEYRGKVSKDKIKEYIQLKISVHIVLKYILIRLIEDTNNKINSKLNVEGISRWKEMSKNFRNDYIKLFQFACDDLRREKGIGEAFVETAYDDYYSRLKSIFNTSQNRKNNYLELLKGYDFRTLDPNTAITVVENIYPSEERENLQKYLLPSPAIDFLLNNLGIR